MAPPVTQDQRGGKKRVGELLISEGFVEPRHVKEALEIQQRKGGKLAQILIDMGCLDVEAFAKFLSSRKGIPSIQLKHYTVQHELCSLIPRQFALSHEVFPIDKLGKLLTVGMVYPLDTLTLEELGNMTGLRVKALLCSADDLRRAIEQHYPPEGAETDELLESVSKEHFASAGKLGEVAKMVRSIDSLPTLPETIQKVKEAARNPRMSARDVAQIVAMDPPIAAKLLHLANSSAYGFPHHVDDVTMATTLLGLKETYMAVLSLGVIDVVSKAKGFDYRAFWRDSMLCAVASKRIGASCGEGKTAGIATGGLLHDIGRFALSEVARGEYAKLDKTLRGEALIQAEIDAIGIAHPEAGYILATHWELPDEITTAIRFHHKPELAKEHKTVAMVVAIGAALTEESHRHPEKAADLSEELRKLGGQLGLNPDDLFAIYEQSRAEADQAGQTS